MRKLDKLVEQNPEQFKEGRQEIYQDKAVAKRFIFPKRFITVRSKDTKKELTEEQRTELSNRMKKLHRINPISKIQGTEPGYLKAPCIGKRTGLKKQYTTTHQCSRDILIISQNYPFAIKM